MTKGADHSSSTDLPARVAVWCDEAGMDGPADKPLRAMLMAVAQAAQDTQRAAEKVGKEAGRQAAQGAATEMRSQIGRLFRELSWVKVLLGLALAVVPSAATWVTARQVPMVTPYGRMTPAQAETFRFNDLGAALNACTPQAPQGTRRWCSVGWWMDPPPPPK